MQSLFITFCNIDTKRYISCFQGFVSGGKDGVVVLWDEMFSQPLRAFQIETSKFPPGTILLHEKPPIRSLHTDEGRIVLGTGHDDIIQIFADGSMEIILQVELLENSRFC